jgi:hypothetical protein
MKKNKIKCPAAPSLHLATNEIEHDSYKGFLWKKKVPKSPDFMEKKFLKLLSFLDNTRFQAGCQKYNRILGIFYFPLLPVAKIG